MKISELIEKKVLEPLSEQIQALSDVKLKLNRLESALEDYRNQKDQINLKLGSLISKATDLMAQGKSFDKVDSDISQVKADLTGIETWISQLEKISIPETKKSVSQTEDVLRVALQVKIRDVRLEVVSLFEKFLAGAMGTQEEWEQAIASLRVKAINISNSPIEARGFLSLLTKDSKFFTLNKMLEG